MTHEPPVPAEREARVARAILEAATAYDGGSETWETIDDWQRQGMIISARAAIAAFSTPPARPGREEIALALINEARRFSRLRLIDKLTDLPEHRYRDQLRYADAILALFDGASA